MTKQMKLIQTQETASQILEEMFDFDFDKPLTKNQFAQKFIDYGNKIKHDIELTDLTYQVDWGIDDVFVFYSHERLETDEEYKARMDVENRNKLREKEVKQYTIDQAIKTLAHYGIKVETD